MITGYLDGADITMIKTQYQKSKKNEEGKYSKDVLTLTFRDNTNGKTFHRDIVSPGYEFYKIHDQYITDYNQLFIEKDKTDTFEVPYKDILKNLAKETNNEKFFKDNIENRKFSDNQLLHTSKELMNSDMDIEDHYRVRFARKYKDRPIAINKGFFDIEVDNINDSNDFPELGKFPIYLLSYVDEKTKTIYDYALRNMANPNPQIKEFEDRLKADPKAVINKIRDTIIKEVGGLKQATRFGIVDYKIEIMFFDEEIELIQSFFSTVNWISPDFMEAWNMPFDIPYIIERIKELGYDPAEIMCHSDYKYKEAIYYIDELHTEFNKKGSTFTISGNTNWIDQLVNFASRRAGTKFLHYTLDYIGSIIAKVRKFDYSHITNKIQELPYKNYEIAFIYNIVDTIVQKCIEVKTGDTDYMYTKCLSNFTRYDKCHRQTVYLTNRATQEFYNQGYIIGNNCNKFNIDKGKFVGALVGDPLHNNDYSKIKINGRPINLARNADDFDYKSLYPSEDLQNNIGINTQIGIVKIEQQVFIDDDKNNVRGGHFLEDMYSDNIIDFCSRWLHFAGYMDCMKDIYEYFTQVSRTMNTMYYLNHQREAINVINPSIKRDRTAIRVISEENRNDLREAIIVRSPEIDFNQIFKKEGIM